jgi:hypothetical protein
MLTFAPLARRYPDYGYPDYPPDDYDGYYGGYGSYGGGAYPPGAGYPGGPGYSGAGGYGSYGPSYSGAGGYGSAAPPGYPTAHPGYGGVYSAGYGGAGYPQYSAGYAGGAYVADVDGADRAGGYPRSSAPSITLVPPRADMLTAAAESSAESYYGAGARADAAYGGNRVSSRSERSYHPYNRN